MLKWVLHRIVSIPLVYDSLRSLAGVQEVERRLNDELIGLRNRGGMILDVGGGTGLHKDGLSDYYTYACLDLDIAKIKGFRAKYPGDLAIVGDAICMPFSDGSIDAVICSMVSHHIPNEVLDAFVSDSARVLSDSGHYIFIDQLWPPASVSGGLFWKYDRGTFPRTSECLQDSISKYFSIEKTTFFTRHNQVMILIAKKKSH